MKLLDYPWEVLRNRPVLFFTVLYAYFCAVGAQYSSTLLNSFGVDALDYWEVSDFFLAALKAIESFYHMLFLSFLLILTYLSFLLYRLLYRFLDRFQPNSDPSILNIIDLKIIKPLNVFLEVFLRYLRVPAYILIATSPFIMARQSAVTQSKYIKGLSTFRADSVQVAKKHDGRLENFLGKVFAQIPEEVSSVNLKILPSGTEKESDWFSHDIRIIASTSKFLIVFDVDSSQTRVIPQSRLLEIKHNK